MYNINDCEFYLYWVSLKWHFTCIHSNMSCLFKHFVIVLTPRLIAISTNCYNKDDLALSKNSYNDVEITFLKWVRKTTLKSSHLTVKKTKLRFLYNYTFWVNFALLFLRKGFIFLKMLHENSYLTIILFCFCILFHVLHNTRLQDVLDLL